MILPSPTGETINAVVLRPGDFYFGGGRTRISTLLGSCVSITLWHPQRHVGGMCHYLLARRNGQSDTLSMDCGLQHHCAVAKDRSLLNIDMV